MICIVDVVAALIWNNDRFMICQRPENKAQALLWEFVGGKVEPGESKEQALIRECKEELNVDVSIGDLFFQSEHKYPDLYIRLTVFNAEIIRGIPVLKEHNNIKWIGISEISQYSFCPADLPVLEKLMRMRKGKV